MKKISFRYHPSLNGLAQVFGSLETEIMEILWNRGEINGRSLFEEIQRLHDVAYTTILTVVGRLVKKGYIKREKKEGVFVYSPAMDKKDFNDHISKSVIQGLMNLSADSAMVNFVDILSELDDTKIEELYSYIEENLNARKSDL